MTRETWRRARGSFDQAYLELKETMLPHWNDMANETLSAGKVSNQEVDQ